jgi:hypothetical protein
VTAVILDWSGRDGSPAAKVGDLQPCIHCGGLALPRHPVSKQPCHKIYEEARLTELAMRTGGGQ